MDGVRILKKGAHGLLAQVSQSFSGEEP